MKKFVKVLFAFVVAVCVAFGTYYFSAGSGRYLFEGAPQTTVTKPQTLEKTMARTLLASLEDEDFYLYKSGKTVILVHNSKEYEFYDWSSVIDEEEPQMYLFDLDGDGDSELVVRGVCGEDSSTGEYVYDLYVVNPATDDEGKETFIATVISQDTWRNFLDKYIVEEISQLKNCDKIIQFAMTSAGENIAYNTKTGIAETGHAGYARALQDKNGKYLTISTWGKGKGMYYVSSDGILSAEIDVDVNYYDSAEVQKAGKIYFEISIDEENKPFVTPKSMLFTANGDYRVAEPVTTTVKQWGFTEQNSAQPGSSGEISLIRYSPRLDNDTVKQTVNLGGEPTDIRYVDSIAVSSSRLVLTAKKGFTFNEKVVNSPAFSVVINKGTSDEYDIAYTASLNDTASVLTITFDRAYAESEIKTLEINFGS